MIKVIVEKQKFYDEDFDDLNFDTNAEFILDEEATTNSAIKMFADALLLEGYHINSILRSMRDYLEENKDY